MSDRYQYQMERMTNFLKIEKKMPQLHDLNLYLQSQSGFKLKPVHGIVSQR